MGRRETENIWADVFPEYFFLSHLNQEKLESHQSRRQKASASSTPQRLERDSNHEEPAQPCGDVEAEDLRDERAHLNLSP